jgi:hypothetical protein
MTEHFLPFKSGATTTSGKLLAINPASVSAIYSQWQEDLGLSEYTDSWVLDLAAKDLA